MKDHTNANEVATTSKINIPEERRAQLIKQYEKCPVSSGRTQYLRYLKGEKLTYREALLANCAECCCGYEDGREDCGIAVCPIYPHMPYRGKIQFPAPESLDTEAANSI